jgi:hypothetical protein
MCVVLVVTRQEDRAGNDALSRPEVRRVGVEHRDGRLRGGSQGDEVVHVDQLEAVVRWRCSRRPAHEHGKHEYGGQQPQESTSRILARPSLLEQESPRGVPVPYFSQVQLPDFTRWR